MCEGLLHLRAAPAVATILLLVVQLPLTAQQRPAPQVVEENLPWPMQPTNYSPPRTPFGDPDMQGTWTTRRLGLPTHSLEDGADPIDEVLQNRVQTQWYANVLVDPRKGRIPYTAKAAAEREQRLRDLFTPTKWSHLEIHSRCLLSGIPRQNNYRPFKIVQQPGAVVFIYDYTHAYRVVPVDGRPHVGENIKLWMGDSRGRWEGNTLVIDIGNQNDKTNMDYHMTFHSDRLHTVERWTMVSPDTIFYEATFTDPVVFTRPWTISITYDRRNATAYEAEMWEDACYEGHRYQLMLDNGRFDKARGRTGIHWHPLEERQKK